MGQNQENSSATTGYKVTIDNMNVTKFLGAFRYKGWETPPTPIYLPHAKHKFNWVLYAEKLRNKRR